MQIVYDDPRPDFNAATPVPSPDGKILTAAVGSHSEFIQDTRTHTFDVALPANAHRPVVNYPDPEFSVIGKHNNFFVRIGHGTDLAPAYGR